MGCTGSKEKAPKGDKPKDDSLTPAATDTPKTDKPVKEKGKKKGGKLMQVLVAGYQQSGKSTFFKQLQIIHLNGWGDEYSLPQSPV